MTIFKTKKITNHCSFARVTIVLGKSFIATQAQMDTFSSTLLFIGTIFLPVIALSMGV